ncbi:MAG TPA: VOC family protein [Acidimicrobiia bacterium]
MISSVQVAVDCHDPHALADFWAAVMGYEVEFDDDFIRGLIAAGQATEDDVIEHNGHVQWKTAAACRDPEGKHPRLLFQQVPEPKSVKNRWHLDIHIGEGRESEIERFMALGATHLWDGRQGPHTWVTLADPEGNEFCVS